MLRQILITIAGCAVLAHQACADVNVWTPFGPEGGQGGAILAHPTDVNRLFAVGAGRVFRSDDAAASWQPVMNGLPDGRSEISIALSPANPDVVYAVVRSEAVSSLERVFRTNNAGLRWQRLPYIRPSGSKIVDISVSPSNADQLVITNSAPGPAGVVMSDNGGRSFFGPTTGYATVNDFTTTATRHGALAYAAVRNPLSGGPRIYRSLNGGATWAVAAALPSSAFAVLSLRTAPTSSAILYGSGEEFPAACIDPCIDGFSSSDSGASWTARSAITFQPWISPNNAAVLLQPFFNTISASINSGIGFTPRLPLTNGYFFDVAGHPGYPTIPTFYASSMTRGILKTTNNGVSSAPANFGFNATPIQALGIFNINATNYRLYAGHDSELTSDGLSTRGISDFAPPTGWINLPVATVGAQGVPAVQLDYTTSSRIYAGNNGPALLRSINTGANWNATTLTGITSVNAIAIDPRSCISPPVSGPCTAGPLQTLFIGGSEDSTATLGASSRALQVSDDGGATFNGVTGIPRPLSATQVLRVSSIAINNSNRALVYAGTVFVGSGGFAGSTNGIFKSINNGRNWSPANTGLPQLQIGANTAYNVGAIETTPTNGSVIYAGMFDTALTPSVLSGLYKSSNDGASWALVGMSGRMIRDIVVSPNNANVVYVALSGTAAGPGGVVRSLNAGATWESISTGLPAAGAFALAARGAQLFAGTPSGVYDFFQGPDSDLDNVTTTIEDAAPNAGDLNVDGILDSLQSKTASFLIKTINDGLTGVEARRGRTNYSNEDTGGVAIVNAKSVQAGCDQLNNAYGIDPEIYPADEHPSGIVYDASDLGLVNVELDGCAAAVVTVRFDDGNFLDPLNWTWRNYGPMVPGDDSTFGWYNFAGAQRINATTWRLTINANQLGVYRAEPNSILLRGGPSFFPERMFTNGFE
jgi:hypothetical protein